MPIEKRQSEDSDIWVRYVTRPLSILFSLPFLNTRLSPTDVTKLSVLSTFIGFFLISFFPTNMIMKVIGWFFFFIWAILDGVDGNLARAKNLCSKKGELWDAIGGYATMILIYFSSAIVVLFDYSEFYICAPYILFILGCSTSVISIFPRLIMHKKANIYNIATKSMHDKRNAGIIKKIAQNFIGVDGGFQFIFLICLIFHLMNIFVIGYFIVNVLMMLISMHNILKE